MIFTITQKTSQLPEDSFLSLGNSTARMRGGYIDNYANVAEYQYQWSNSISSKKFALKDIAHSFWEEIAFSTEQYVQGICFAEPYVLISAYFDEKDVLGEVMVFHQDTGEYLLTLGLNEDSHLGGVAFDGTNIWICNSERQAIERFSYDSLCEMIEAHRYEKVDITNLVDVYPVANIPSCITYYDDSLWIATHHKYTESVMMRYIYDENTDRLRNMDNYKIPSKVQGLVFDTDGSLYVSSSYGRRNSSYLRKYSSVYAMSQDTKKYELLVEMPPCSEGVALFEDALYILFE